MDWWMYMCMIVNACLLCTGFLKAHLISLEYHDPWKGLCICVFQGQSVNKSYIWCKQVLLTIGFFCPTRVHASLPPGNVQVSIIYAWAEKLCVCLSVYLSISLCYVHFTFSNCKILIADFLWTPYIKPSPSAIFHCRCLFFSQ